jgi:hypothetical protein
MALVECLFATTASLLDVVVTVGRGQIMLMVLLPDSEARRVGCNVPGRFRQEQRALEARGVKVGAVPGFNAIERA